MKNKLWGVLLCLPAVVLTAIIVYLNCLTHFTRVEVAVRGYDPKDFFAGYYILLQPDWSATDCSQFADGICPKDDFAPTYNFYIKREQSDKISRKVNAGVVKLVFSHSPQHRPVVVDLLVDGKSYMDFIKN